MKSSRHQKESMNDAGIAHIRFHAIKNFRLENFTRLNRAPAIHPKLSRENIGLKTALLGTFVSFLKLSTHRACDSICAPLRFAHFIICKNKPERPSAFLWRFISRLQKLLEEEERQNHLSTYLKGAGFSGGSSSAAWQRRQALRTRHSGHFYQRAIHV